MSAGGGRWAQAPRAADSEAWTRPREGKRVVVSAARRRASGVCFLLPSDDVRTEDPSRGRDGAG